MSKSLIFKISLDIRLSAYILTKNDSFASIILGFLEVFSTFSLENTSKWLLLTLEAFTKDTILLSLSTTLKRFPLDMTVLFAKFTPSQLISCTFCKIYPKTFRNKSIQSGYRKTRTRRNSVFRHFSRSVYIFIHIRCVYP